jgi:hypothetical protein
MALAQTLLPIFEYIHIEGPEKRGPQRVLLERVYVSTPIFPNTDRNGTPIRAEQLLQVFHRAVVIGDPGGGKSTLGQKICKDLLERCAGGNGPLPLRIELRRYEAALQREPQLSMFSYVARELVRQTNDGAEEILQLKLQYLLNFGWIVLFFDGLDEILEVGRRRRFVNDVEVFCSHYAMCPVLVTSREVGYDQAPMHELPVFWLGRFGLKEVEKYVSLSSNIVFNKSEAEGSQAARYFQTRFEQEQDLMRNPLMLALMVWLYHGSRSYLPNNRAEIYRECSLLTFERWDQIREIHAEKVEYYELLDLLTHLASKIYPDPRLRSGVNRKWLEGEVWEFFRSQLTEDRDQRARRAAKAVVDSITHRTWVMTDIGSDSYEFTHRTFLEFFFGRHLQDQYETVDALILALVPRISVAEWNVPCHVAIQLKIGHSASAVAAVARKIVQEFTESGNLKYANIAARFIMQAQEYLPAAEPELEDMAQFVTRYTVGTDEWSDHLHYMLRTSAPRRQAIFRGISQGIVALMNAYDPKVVGRVCDWIYEARLRERYSGSGVPSDQAREFIGIFSRTAKPWLQRSEPAAVVKARFDVLGELDEDSAQIYGARLWASSLPYPRISWLLVDLRLMLVELLTVAAGERPIDEQQYARLGLAIAPALRSAAPSLLPPGLSEEELYPWVPAIDWIGLQAIKGDEVGVAAGTVALAYLELAGDHERERSGQEVRTIDRKGIALDICNRLIGAVGEEGSFFRKYRNGALRLFDGVRSLFTSIAI